MHSRKKGRRQGAIGWVIAAGLAIAAVVGMSGVGASASQLGNGCFVIRSSSDGGEFVGQRSGGCKPPATENQWASITLGEFETLVDAGADNPWSRMYLVPVKAEPARTVEVRIDGRSLGNATIAEDGTGMLDLRPSIDEQRNGSTVEVCYITPPSDRHGCVSAEMPRTEFPF